MKKEEIIAELRGMANTLSGDRTQTVGRLSQLADKIEGVTRAPVVRDGKMKPSAATPKPQPVAEGAEAASEEELDEAFDKPLDEAEGADNDPEGAPV